MSRPMMIAVVHDRRCHCCEKRGAPTLSVPLAFGTYRVVVDLCEVCVRVAGAAFDVAGELARAARS